MDSPDLSISYEQKFTLEVQKEATFVMRERDWGRMRRRLESVQKQRREFAAVGWASLGAAVTAVFSAISWAPAYRAFPADQQPEFAWVWPAIVALGLLGVFLGAGMFWAAHVTKSAESASVQQVLDDMNEIRAVGN